MCQLHWGAAAAAGAGEWCKQSHLWHTLQTSGLIPSMMVNRTCLGKALVSAAHCLSVTRRERPRAARLLQRMAAISGRREHGCTRRQVHTAAWHHTYCSDSAVGAGGRRLDSCNQGRCTRLHGTMLRQCMSSIQRQEGAGCRTILL